jgi:hypothetical protein
LLPRDSYLSEKLIFYEIEKKSIYIFFRQLNEDEKLEIIRLKLDGNSMKDIQKFIKCTRRQISHTWKKFKQDKNVRQYKIYTNEENILLNKLKEDIKEKKISLDNIYLLDILYKFNLMNKDNKILFLNKIIKDIHISDNINSKYFLEDIKNIINLLNKALFSFKDKDMHLPDN